MKYYVLSLDAIPHTLGYTPVYELSQVLQQSLGAVSIPVSEPLPVGSYRHKLHHLTGYRFIADRYVDDRLSLSSSQRTLFVPVVATNSLRYLHLLSDWRKKFNRVIAYILDPWEALRQFPKQIPRDIDLFCVPDQYTAQRFHQEHGINTLAVPMAVDVLKYCRESQQRPLDIVAYGRQSPAYMTEIKAVYNRPESRRLMVFDTVRSLGAKDYGEHRALTMSLMMRAKSALAFDTLFEPGERQHKRSIVPVRYFEAAAAGTAIVGRHPQTNDMETLFGWQDAVIDLPSSAADTVPFLEDLFADSERLEQIHRRNFQQSALAHDWRYRIADVLNHLSLAPPDSLNQQLSAVANLAARR